MFIIEELLHCLSFCTLLGYSLSVLWITAFDYPFGIFKRLLQHRARWRTDLR